MNKEKFAILTVLYNDNKMLYDMSIKAFNTFPDDVEIYCIVNKKLKDVHYPDYVKYIKNDENCLARAWNIGLKEIFKKYDYAIVSGLDSICPTLPLLQNLVKELEVNPEYGITAAMVLGMKYETDDIKHGDGSFSFYCISKETFEKVGDFNEEYKPAYFEDSDYLERLWINGYMPHKLTQVVFYHMTQGTVKYSPKIQKDYAGFMNKNLAIFKKKYNKVPDHLPPNIIFGQ